MKRRRPRLERNAVGWLAALVLATACGTVDPIDPEAPDAFATTTSASTTRGHRADPTNASTEASDADESTGTSTALDDTGDEDECVAGHEGCPCASGSACDLGLACLSMICVDPGPHCPVGSKGCPCTPGGGCDPGLECDENVCG